MAQGTLIEVQSRMRKTVLRKKRILEKFKKRMRKPVLRIGSDGDAKGPVVFAKPNLFGYKVYKVFELGLKSSWTEFKRIV